MRWEPVRGAPTFPVEGVNVTAAVYVVGGNRDHEELRYSLRSVEANAPDVTQVWIVGHVPDWVTGVRELPLDPLPEKFANQRQSLTAFANLKGAPRKFYLFNEDHYIIERVDGVLPVFHLGDAVEYITAPHVWSERNTWCHAVRNTAEWLNERTGGRCLSYTAHTPVLMDRGKVRDLLAEYPADRSLDLFLLYNLAGLAGVGVDAGNAKVRGGDLAEKQGQDMPYLSGNQESFNGELGRMLKDRFPAPSRWEKP